MSAFIDPGVLRLEIKNPTPVDQTALTRACAVACEMVERGWTDARGRHPGVGVVVQTTTVERVRGRSRTLALSNRCLSLTSVVDERTGAAVDPASLVVDGQFLHTRSGERVPHEWLTVTYEAGWVAEGDPPPWAVEAALILASWRAAKMVRQLQRTDEQSMELLRQATEVLADHQLLEMGFA